MYLSVDTQANFLIISCILKIVKMQITRLLFGEILFKGIFENNI